MLDIHQKRKIRTIMYHYVTLAILGIVVLFAIHSTWTVYRKEKESVVMMQAAQKKADQLMRDNADLQKKIDDLQTAQGIEAEIRDKFNVAKTDENVIIVVDPAVPTTTQVMHNSLWQKFKNLFVRN